MRENIRHTIYDYLEERESSDFLTELLIDMFVDKLEEIKKDMEGCTGEDCMYPLDKTINELK